MFITVFLSVVASKTMSNELLFLTVYVAVASTVPGKPFSPSFAFMAKTTDESVLAFIS